jgi:hypothetical protein
MKKVLTLIIALILLTAMTTIVLAADTTVYVTVSIDDKLEVAAQPVTVSDLTVQGAIKAAHAAYCSSGESGYSGGIDKNYNMFLITKVWGISVTPYVIVNGAPLGSQEKTATADVAPIKAGDNIIICLSSDPSAPAMPVSLTASVSGGAATVTATAWVMDFTTFTYSSAPLANAAVIDPATGTSLGTTGADGTLTVTIPESGIAAIDGLAAINVNAATAPESPAAAVPAPSVPAAADTPLFYPPTNSLLIAMAIILPPVLIVILIKMAKQSRLDKQAAASKK